MKMNKSVLQRGIIFILCICIFFQSVRFMLLQQEIRKRKLSGLVYQMQIREELRRFCIKLKLGKRHVKYDDEK